MADILSRSLLRAVRWAVDAARMELAADEVLCDLGRYRSTLEMVGMVANPTAYLAESAALLESEIRAREAVQARAGRWSATVRSEWRAQWLTKHIEGPLMGFEVTRMANSARHEVQSATVARQPGKPKKGEPYRMHIILPGELVHEVDALAQKMSAERAGLTVTRTDVARMAIHEYVDRQVKVQNDIAAEHSEVKRAALMLGGIWGRKFAKPSELKRAAAYVSNVDSFRGEPMAPHTWWTSIVEEFPSLDKLSHGNVDSMPDVDDDTLKILESDDAALAEFCESLLQAGIASGE